MRVGEGCHYCRPPPQDGMGEQQGATNSTVPSGEGDFARALGRRMRAARNARGLTLADVQAISHGKVKASVLGAYERGERPISVTRLERLARLYRVSVTALLPGAPAGATGNRADIPAVFDLAQLRVASGPEAEMLRRYLAQLYDFTGRVLSVRAKDLRAVAWALGMDEATLEERLVALGILSTSRHHG